MLVVPPCCHDKPETWLQQNFPQEKCINPQHPSTDGKDYSCEISHPFITDNVSRILAQETVVNKKLNYL